MCISILHLLSTALLLFYHYNLLLHVQANNTDKTTNTRHLQQSSWTPPSYTCSPSNGCSTSTNKCIANPNHGQKSTDELCSTCQTTSQTYWPCDVDGLCYCWDTSKPRIPPAPSTKLPINTVTDPCDDILTLEIFNQLAPEAQHPYSYRGFCQAVRDYNTNHPNEGIFNMGTSLQQRQELAAFFGHVLHESDDMKAGREYLTCADHKFVAGEMYCKPCDMAGFDWEEMKCIGESLVSEGRAYNGYCQSNLLPPDGCECDNVYEISQGGEMAGYVKANKVYFGRGAIQLSWNYNYIKASVAVTGHSQTFCQRPDLVATKEEYAWGAGLFYWNENVKHDWTCHQAVLMNGDFGQTLDVINGGLECPADDHGWHGKAVQLRLNRYCRAATALGLETLLSFDGCMDMDKKFVQCLKNGNCEDCKVWEGKVSLPDINTILTVEEGGAGNGPPTKKPRRTKRPTKRPNTRKPVTSLPTNQPTVKISGPCSGEPCPVPPGIEDEFCRSANGICGTGPPYCNAHSTWTSFCFNCDSDSPFGCPTFGCNDCSGETQQCVGNKNGINPIRDGECEPCGQGQTFYPCDISGSKGCWCWDTRLPRVEPAPPSGLEVLQSSTGAKSPSIGAGVCGEIIDETKFRLLAPNARSPFTYDGFCIAIDHYNSRHAEKVFRMGTKHQRINELIAFLGIASHETDGFTAAREYLACGDNMVVDGELYCVPCTSDKYDFGSHSCSVSMLANNQSYLDFCQPYTTPPKGCNCEYLKEVESSGLFEGHVKANDVFFGRGSIQLSNNFNYIRASATMTGSDDTFCKEPELLSTVESYSWGVGLYIWMEFMVEEGKTGHVHTLEGNYGSALNIINGASECPVKGEDEWYSGAIRRRLDHYCNVAKVMGANALLSFDGCEGLDSTFRQCVSDGSCPNCFYFDSTNIETPLPTESSTVPPKIVSPPQTLKPRTPPPSQSISKTPRPTIPTPKTSAPMSVLSPGATSFSTSAKITSAPTNRPTRLPTLKPTPSPTNRPTRSPEKKIQEENEDIMTNWAITSLEYPPTNAPTLKPQPLSTTRKPVSVISSPRPPSGENPAKESDGKVENELSHNEPFSESFNHQIDEGDIATSVQVDDRIFIFTPFEDTTISRSNPDTNYGSEPSMIVNMMNGDIALMSFDLSDIGDAVIEKVELQLALLDENSLNAGIFYVQPTMTRWTENTVTYNSAPAVGGKLFAASIDRIDSTHLKLDVTKAVENKVVSFRVIGTNRIVSELGSKESSNKSDVPELVVTIAAEKPAFTSLRPVNDSTSGKENPYDLSQLYQGKPSASGGQISSGNAENSPTGKVSGHVWLDKNYDGVKEADEPGLRGVLVDLYSCDDHWVQGSRTSSNGDYIFENLSEGIYYVQVTADADYRFTSKNVGPDDSKDSDINTETGRSDCIDLSSPSQLHSSIDVGMVRSELESIDLSMDVAETDTEGGDYNCRGRPCLEGEGYCRSEHNYCGTGDAYCNTKSQWTSECPSAAPTIKPTIEPTTNQPSFSHEEGVNCSGEPCTDGDGTWCRSELGFCGGGKFYCNTDSTWLPKCVADNSNEQTLADVLDKFNSMAKNITMKPSKAPTEMTEFSSFALPTLSQISDPKQVDTTMLGNVYGIEAYHYDFHSDTPKSEIQNTITIEDNDTEGGQNIVDAEAWYIGLLGEARSSGTESLIIKSSKLCLLTHSFIIIIALL